MESEMNYPHYRGKSRDASDSDFSSFCTVDFPKRCKSTEVFIENERQFHLLIALSKNIQRSLGWHSIVNSNVFYPDVTALLIGGLERINVELEYNASSFFRHKHSGRCCDLLISFKRKTYETMIRGLPVWSFYVENGDYLEWTLDVDVKSNCGIDDLGYGFSFDS